MTVTVKFLGGAGTVTGSKYLVRSNDHTVMVDAGLFQGKREWRERNWHTPEHDLSSVDAVLLTHAHIDHTGMLPRFFSLGLNCPVFCSAPTTSLCSLLLPDSAHLQEEEAEWRNKKGRSRHSPALPLYTTEDALGVLKKFKSVPFDEKVQIIPGVFAEWRRMGHILGAASIRLWIEDKLITFSGDIGRYDIPILKDPQPSEFGDLLLIESTYGERLHEGDNPKAVLADVITKTVKRDGIVVIPSFAVGRAQLLLYYIRELQQEGKIPNIPVIIDSPMATNATSVYKKHPEGYDEEALAILKEGNTPFEPEKIYYTRDRRESKKLNGIVDPMIIISASGMLSGGRVLHHLFQRISSPKNTILFVGYQPPGGRGDWILGGAKSLKLFGEDVSIRAHIEQVSGLSAHGDRDEMLKWCESCTGTPKQVAVTHGEPDAAKSFALTLNEKYSWDAFHAQYLQEIEV